MNASEKYMDMNHGLWHVSTKLQNVCYILRCKNTVFCILCQADLTLPTDVLWKKRSSSEKQRYVNRDVSHL